MESLTVPGNLDSLSAIAQYVMAAADAAGLDKKASYKLRLAVDEVTTNIIIHGYEENHLQGDVYMMADLDDSSLTITVEDTATAFDPFPKLSLEEEKIGLPMEQRPIGGLGVYLAIQGVDKFFYERVGDRNRNTFVVKRTTANAQ
ncbi:ATP-binding protein [Planktothrix sp. FACHB-1355]|uniref:ATP-binding protein n=1 Tax=Aerosakkonema funiforme FACHB-1375 TaxID=2949571 RepID=A0A926V9H6_9CYAN|nr:MULTISPECIES: ATP-binding protein [Oscillatoriales]MBD2179764.1 ATP-binding protein [Aerosakkonema funiforme FACHB-1375]MBD3559358.1 ATP-binding protein [Planktothrix sp. FACHB-1355]